MYICVQKRNLITHPPRFLQLGTEDKQKITVYRYWSFFVNFIVIYSPILRPPSHPLDHAITSRFSLSSRHHATNLIQFTITPVNFDLPLDFYGGACRNVLKICFLLVSAINVSTTESYLITVSILKAKH